MTTDTEALRAQFEAWARKNELEAERHKYADDQYDDHAATRAWRAWRDAFQVGHAAAKAETADVGEPAAWMAVVTHPRSQGPQAYFVSDARLARQWDYNGVVDGEPCIVQPLFTAHQLAAAVAKERGYWQKELHALLEAADAVATNNAHAVSTGSVRYAKHSQTWEAYASLEKARQRAADAIRAGAKEPSDG